MTKTMTFTNKHRGDGIGSHCAPAHAVGVGQTDLPVNLHGIDLQALPADAKRAKWPAFKPPAAGLSHRHRGKLLHCRFHHQVQRHDVEQASAHQAAIGRFSPTSVTRCMIRRMLALSNGSTECIVQRLSHMMTSSFAHTCR